MAEPLPQDLAALRAVLPTKRGQPYWWTVDGVYKPGEEGKPRRLTFRPLVPSARGRDQDGGLHMRLSWVDWDGALQHRWVPDVEARSPKALEALPGAPVDPTCSREIARWVSYGVAGISSTSRDLVSRLGWAGETFLWPGHMDGKDWIGQDLAEPKDREATTKALRMLCDLPERAGYLALVCAGLSAASPLVRWGCARNPILGLTERTSRGKSTAMRFALSLWGDHRTWSMQLSSTSKGVQDLAIQYPDTPVLVDDLHKLHHDNPAMVADLLYFLGNGQRRTTSSRTQVARGGEVRHGVAMYGSESSVLGGSNGGVLMRVWEIPGSPMPDAATARAVEEATQRGAGAIGPLLARWYSERGARWREILSHDYVTADGKSVETSALSAGDVSAIRVLAHGLRALKSVALVERLDEVDICRWLMDRIQIQRAQATDTVRAAWEDVVQYVIGGSWGKDVATSEGVKRIKPETLEIQGQVVAWRDGGWQLGPLDSGDWKCLDINVNAEGVQRIMWRHGGARTLLPAWAERGWIQRNGPHLRWQRRDHGRVAVRLSPEQLAEFTAPDAPPEEPA